MYMYVYIYICMYVCMYAYVSCLPVRLPGCLWAQEHLVRRSLGVVWSSTSSDVISALSWLV